MRALFGLAFVPLLIMPATPDATPMGPVHDRCVAVPPAMIEWVSTGLDSADDTSLESAWMVRSDDFEYVWFLAADLEGPGLDGTNQVALWATDVPLNDGSYEEHSGGMVLSVNGFALEFSNWLHAKDYNIHPDDDGAELALDCAAGKASD